MGDNLLRAAPKIPGMTTNTELAASIKQPLVGQKLPKPMNGVKDRFGEPNVKLEPSLKRPQNGIIPKVGNVKEKVSDYVEKNKDKIYILMFIVLKATSILMTYLSLYVTTNYMSNVYVNDTIIEGREAPALTTYAVLFTILNIFTNSISLVLTMVMTYILDIEIDIINLILEIMGYILVLGILAYILCFVMENRKYFLYEDDGMRAFRALQTIILYQGIVVVLIPYSKILNIQI